MNQNAFARFEFAALKHIGPHREIVFGQSSGLQKGVALGDGQCLAFGYGHVFGIGTAVGQGANFVAQLPTSGTFAQGHHFTRHF